MEICALTCMSTTVHHLVACMEICADTWMRPQATITTRIYMQTNCTAHSWNLHSSDFEHTDDATVSVAIAAVDLNAIRYAFLHAYISEPFAAPVNSTDNTSSSHSAPEHRAAH